MFELKGEYNNCKVFNDHHEDKAVEQLTALLNQQCVAGSRIRIMPDYHAGKGAVIGTTMTLTDKVIPNLVGVDIGCGMLAVKLQERKVDFSTLDRVIRDEIPSGREIHSKGPASDPVEDLFCDFNLEKALLSIGTLGGGNHFIEVDKDSTGNLWLVIHTGSRHLGLEVIPMNMRDGSLLCIGKGNEDWNWSAPHGAGRIMSRNKARESISIAEYENSMKGIYSTCIGRETIDESPMAYKPMEEIIFCIEDAVTVTEVIKPVYNFKAGD